MDPSLQVIHGNAAERALSAIRIGILDGRLTGGTRLREVQLARSLSVSRTPVREAIGRLVTEGLVIRDEFGNPWVFRPNLAELTEIYEIRISLESLAAHLAVEESASDLSESIRSHLDQLNAAKPGHEWAEKHDEFHLALYVGCGRQRLLSYIRTLRAQSEPYVRLAAQVDRTFADEADRQHEEMARLVDTRDGTAIAMLVRNHLQATLNRAPGILGLQQRST
jgi:DNA-binding GntR family transcriptional regulator